MIVQRNENDNLSIHRFQLPFTIFDVHHVQVCALNNVYDNIS